MHQISVDHNPDIGDEKFTGVHNQITRVVSDLCPLLYFLDLIGIAALIPDYLHHITVLSQVVYKRIL